jgi:hypothetical protein
LFCADMVAISELDFDGHHILATYDKTQFALSSARRSRLASRHFPTPLSVVLMTAPILGRLPPLYGIAATRRRRHPAMLAVRRAASGGVHLPNTWNQDRDST